ncbi:peptidoglycan recognition protein family protein [Paenibacillus endoradicis]|uniref:peptidoglycan recognition protein family protein n=1 Tax=Paenibacillus endoradicis TaxID=2972487 RepID=UPI0021599253|nr:N-acetylmuramoyl-L-alanine amidase [Paenibacillus endoradicis]MCR8656181.1 N-acetylmuramoyl-L-alanine amidase [Paenibacillus endoradicis]
MQRFYLSINYVDFKIWDEDSDLLMSYEYRQDHIPKTTPYNRRPSLVLEPTSITIHNTGNPSSTAKNERAWLTNTSNDRVASFHIVMDEKEAIEVLPLNEVAWHAGDGSGMKSGNRTSIGIEICESGNYSVTLDHAIELVAKMLHERGWGIERLRRHYDWSGKNCPRLMNSDGKWSGWTVFVNKVNVKLQALNVDSSGESEGEADQMSVEDANKIIKFLSAAYLATDNKEARNEFNRLANELRKASGQKPSSG